MSSRPHQRIAGSLRGPQGPRVPHLLPHPGESELAEDATQEVFLRVFEQINRFEGRSTFSTWLYRLAVNHALNFLKQKRRRERISVGERADPAECLPDLSCTPHDAVTQREHRRELQHLLSLLSIEHRTVVVLREIEELSYREIAAVLDIPAGTVMSRLSRAREALRKAWETVQKGAAE